MPWISLPTLWEEHFADFGQVREIKFLFWPPENEILFKIDDLWKIIPRNVSKIYESRNWLSCMVVESLVNMEKSVNKIQVRENLEKSGNFTEKNKSWNDTLLLEKTFLYKHPSSIPKTQNCRVKRSRNFWKFVWKWRGKHTCLVWTTRQHQLYHSYYNDVIRSRYDVKIWCHFSVKMLEFLWNFVDLPCSDYLHQTLRVFMEMLVIYRNTAI